MSTAAATEQRVWTTEELLALPDDGVERWLIRGRLYEKHPDQESPDMTKRNRFHSVAEGRITGVLFGWLRTQPEPRGEVVCGEVGFVLRRNPDSTVGIDVAVITAEMADANPHDSTLYDGHPVLAVEIPSPYDMQDEVMDKVDGYLASGTPLVWVVEPRHRTVTVYRPDAEPVLFNRSQTLTAEPHLPGFSCSVGDLFR